MTDAHIRLKVAHYQLLVDLYAQRVGLWNERWIALTEERNERMRRRLDDAITAIDRQIKTLHLPLQEPTMSTLECANEGQADVLAAVIGERRYQNVNRGTVHEAPHEVGGWIMLMRKYLTDAEIAWSTQSDDKALDELRKVVALGVACFEQHGVPSRLIPQHHGGGTRGDARR